jgi:hypothetical protein
MNKNGNL